jgi:hypothetical protein
MLKIQWNQEVILGEGHKLDTCPIDNLIKNGTNEGKNCKGEWSIRIQEQGIVNEDIVKILCAWFFIGFKNKICK